MNNFTAPAVLAGAFLLVDFPNGLLNYALRGAILKMVFRVKKSLFTVRYK